MLTQVQTSRNMIQTDFKAVEYSLVFLLIYSEFSDNTARFYCRIYFAEQFRKLRKLIFPAGEEM